MSDKPQYNNITEEQLLKWIEDIIATKRIFKPIGHYYFNDEWNEF